MSDTIIVAIISGLFTAGGAVVSVLTANRVTAFRIQQLEDQVRKHNNIIERTYKLEETCAVIRTELKTVDSRLHDLESEDRK